VATFSRLKSGSWRVQVRRKGKYVNDTFLRRKDAEEWALEIERRIDRGEPPLAVSSRELRRFGDLVRLHRDDLQEVGKRIGRSKNASLTFLEERIGRLQLQELDRDRLIQFGKEHAVEGAGPVTLGMDLGYVKTILSHAAAVHGVPLSTESIDLARIALGRLGLIGKRLERDRRPTQDELDRLIAAFEANIRQQIPLGRIIRQCRDLKIEDLHFRNLRHEGTSRLFEAGFSIEQVTLVTGHRDWKMLRRYTHLKPEGLRKTHPQNGASLAATAARASSG